MMYSQFLKFALCLSIVFLSAVVPMNTTNDMLNTDTGHLRSYGAIFSTDTGYLWSH